MPPAFVARLPPIRAVPSEASDSGKSRPAASAAACTSASVMPASAIISPSSGQSPRIRFIRSSDRISGAGPSGTTCPSTSPVPPPQGTIPTRAAAQARTTRATSSVERGRASTAAGVTARRRGSSR